MILKQYSNRLITIRLVKLFSLLILMVVARHAFAQGSCATDADNGYAIGDKCYTLTDSNNNYLGSICQPFPGDDPTSNYHVDCLQGVDQGQFVCTGSTCEGSGDSGSGCTYHGFCVDDFDCCGLNWCDQDLQRCQEWESGPVN
jgi:hypothetical protein